MSFNNFIRVSNMEVSSCCQFGGLIRNQNGFRASVMTSYAWSLVLILYNAPAKSAMYLLHDRYFRFTNPPVFVHSSVMFCRPELKVVYLLLRLCLIIYDSEHTWKTEPLLFRETFLRGSNMIIVYVTCILCVGWFLLDLHFMYFLTIT